jgi:hypothetical protein
MDSASSAAVSMILFELHFVTLQQVNKDSTLHFSAELVKNAI